MQSASLWKAYCNYNICHKALTVIFVLYVLLLLLAVVSRFLRKESVKERKFILTFIIMFVSFALLIFQRFIDFFQNPTICQIVMPITCIVMLVAGCGLWSLLKVEQICLEQFCLEQLEKKK